MLANVYLHYVLDLWAERWRQTAGRGDVIVVRFADDFVVGFQHREEAERFLAELREGFAQFSLELAGREDAPDRVRPVRRQNADGSGDRQAGDIHFLGFTHMCGRTGTGASRFGA